MKTNAPNLSLDQVKAAHALIKGGIRRTPTMALPRIPELDGLRIWLKRDDLQRTRSFKERGALHALLTMDAGRRNRGVVAASAGNHALGLAFHGSRLGIEVTVVMPVNASAVKISRCRGLGADVRLSGETYDEAQRAAEALAAESGAQLVHPFDDLAVMAGQGTMALEILEDVPKFQTLVIPVGGGGLLAGVATVVKAMRPEVRVVAVQPERAAGWLAAQRSGRPVDSEVQSTLADGLAVSRVGEKTFASAQHLIDGVVTVSEEEIAAAASLLARQAGIVAEGAGAVSFAAVLGGKVLRETIVVPISGGNIDPGLHAQIVADGRRICRMQSRAA